MKNIYNIYKALTLFALPYMVLSPYSSFFSVKN